MTFPPFLLSIFGMPPPKAEKSFMHHSYLREMVLTSIVSVVRHMCVKMSYKRELISAHKSVLRGELLRESQHPHDGLDFVQNDCDSHSSLGNGKLRYC